MAELVALLSAPRRATVSGRLFAVPDLRGHYPVLTVAEGAECVSGTVFAPGPLFGADELAELDAFEGFDPADPIASDYVRDRLHANLADDLTLDADAYLWNRPVAADFIPIAHGDFARSIAESGVRPLPG